MATRLLERFWESLEDIPGLSLIMDDWQFELAEDFPFANQFLQPTSEIAQTFPCGRSRVHGCRRNVVEHGPGDIVACCSLSLQRCDTVRVEESRLALQVVSVQRLSEAMASAFGLDVQHRAETLAERLWSIGAYACDQAARWPVYFTTPNTLDDLRGTIVKLLAAKPGRFVLLTPTARYWEAESIDLIKRHGSHHLALRRVLRANDADKLVADVELRSVFEWSQLEEPTEQPAEYVFRRVGEYWVVIYEGNETHLRDSKGIRCLSLLLHDPGTVLHSIALDSAAKDNPGSWQLLVEDGLPKQEKSGLEYLKKQRSDLNYRIEEAEQNNDFATAERLRSEHAAVNQELLSSLGLGSRTRFGQNPVKKSYDNVARAIRSTRKIIKRELPSLETHLKLALKTGNEWCYQREYSVPWAK